MARVMFSQNVRMNEAPDTLFPTFPKEDWRHHRVGIAAAIERVMESGQYILQGEVSAFETEWGAYLGRGEVLGTASGTDAIELMLRGLGIGAGDKVVVPAFAPSAVAAGVLRAGAACLLADCEPGTLCLCPVSLNALLASPEGIGIKAALVVHLFGQMADWPMLAIVARSHGIKLLEDASQAHGAEFHGCKAGTLGSAAAFSFYPSKNLGAMGDAGALVWHERKGGTHVRRLREYGWKRRYVSETPGVNSRLDELQAAVLREKMRSLDANIRARANLAALYSKRLAKIGNTALPPIEKPGVRHAWHQYVVRSDKRDELQHYLNANGVPVAVHYPVPLHEQPAFVRSGACGVSLVNSKKAAAQVLSLPLHPYLSTAAVHTVCDLIEAF